MGAKREIIYLSLHCHHQNDSCIKMGSDESHFNVSVGSDGQSHNETVSTNHNLFEERGEPKRYRTEVFPVYLPNALPLGQTGSLKDNKTTTTTTTKGHNNDTHRKGGHGSCVMRLNVTFAA